MVIFDIETRLKAKMRSDERILVLRPIEGERVRATSGLVDPRLFSGEQDNLRAVRNPSNSMWRFKYESGVLPQPLKQTFTSFQGLLNFAEQYFNRRGLQIIEVQDKWISDEQR